MGNSSQSISRRPASGAVLTITLAMAALLAGCAAPANNTNATSTMNANASSTMANTNSSSTGVASLDAREPERYSTTMTLTGQYTGGQRQGNIPTLQFDFARMDNDRRWSFNLPQPAGQVVYLEKGAQKYLLIPSQNQYVELRPEELGIQIGNVMTPAAVIENLKSRGQHESLGTEPVNGRTAVKYRFTGAADTRTQAGTVQTDSIVYVDQQTGLPLRSEMNTSTTSGATARIVTETRDIQLNPDPALFEIPANLRKVTTEELKQQVRGFIDGLRLFADIMRQQQTTTTTPPPATPPTANANR